MAKPGDLVEFTAGLHGFEPPRNVAILLDRFRRKGVAWVRLMTLDGAKDVKAEHLKARVFRARFEGAIGDEAAVSARLRSLAALHAGGQVQEESEDDLGRLEGELWETACRDGRPAWSEPELAAAHYGPDPSPAQLRNVRAALDRCRRAGTGRFQTTGGRGDSWRAWTQEEALQVRRAWQDLSALRGKLVAVVAPPGPGTALPADGPAGAAGAAGPALAAHGPHAGHAERSYARVPLADAGLSATDHATLRWVKTAMQQYVEWDGVPDGSEPVAGIGGLPVVRVFGLDLHRSLAFLAQDWIAGEHTTTSSDYVQFLLEAGLWTAADAVDSLIRRHVNQEEFFEHTEDARAEETAARCLPPEEEPDPGRTDLRHIPCYTIDPADARDFDDAVGLEAASTGTRLWVHVADVSHYVTPDSYLDRHARRRATSVYLPGRVLPMLPRRLADHLCSLRDDGDRFALSVGLDVAHDGRVTGAQFHKSLIRVTRNMAYGDALAASARGEEPFASLLALAQRMRTHRHGLALETGELKVILESSTFSALEKRADDATRMIEAFMVAANEAVARHLHDEGVPLLFRCHPLPDPTRAERFTHQAEVLGLQLDMALPRKAAPAAATESLLDQLRKGGNLNLFGGGIHVKGGPLPALPAPPEVPLQAAAPATGAPPLQGYAQLPETERPLWLAPFQRAVSAIADMEDPDLADVATLKLLGCLGRAYYSPDNEGHFGLASTHYCHFTSPIRRYPDLVVHRNLKWLLAGRTGSAPHTQESLRAMRDHCSNQEEAADGLERRIKASCLVLATLGQSGMAAARILGITPTSLFVLRSDGIEARAALRDLPGGPLHPDEWEARLVREEPDGSVAEVARLGQRVRAHLAGRDVAAGRTAARLEPL